MSTAKREKIYKLTYLSSFQKAEHLVMWVRTKYQSMTKAQKLTTGKKALEYQ